MSIMNFDVQDLSRIVTDAAAKHGTRQTREEYTKVSYLPDGSHAVSLFIDPDKQIFREVVFHKPLGSKVKCHCPNHLNKINTRNPKWAEFVQSLNEDWKAAKLTSLPACEICEANTKAKEINENQSWKKKLNVNYNHLIYMNLYKTNAPGEYWQPDAEKGTPYVVIGTSKLKKSVVSLLESLQETSGSYITKALNPTVPSPPFTISSTRGTQGQINISASPVDNKPAIIESVDSPPVWWRPLNAVFLQPEFNLEEYEENVKVAKDVLSKFEEEESGKPSSVSSSSVSTGNVPTEKKTSVEGEIQSFLALADKEDLPKFDIRPEIENPKELTSKEVKLESSGELALNQRLSKTGQIVTLPEYAVERECWTKFDSIDPLCLKCPANLECAFSQD